MTEETIFALALEQPDATTRAAFLADACGADAALRQRVEALLRTHEKVGDFLNKPVVEQLAAPPEGSDATQAFNAATDPKGPAMPRTEGEGSSDEQDTPLDFLQPSTRPDSLGLLGHYEVLQVLGRGGFGIVFRAFDEVLHRVVALKVLAPAIASTSPARRRFLREARSSAQVRHDNVVQVYAVEEKPVPYLVMEFIPGETLQQRLDRVGPLDVPEILRLGRQIAEGLSAAHATDLIHRDIKPGNVLLEGGNLRVKITDFGLARAADDASISQSGVIAGTPMFMAPEQALGHKIDQRADLFSLGSVLYQMASGRPPFRAPSALAVLKRVAEEPPRPIPEIIPETPDWLCSIITKLHAKKPDDRFQSAREVADLLADCEAKLKAKQKVKNVLPAAAKPVGRKWVAAAAVLLLPVIALALTELAGVTHLFRGQQPMTDPIKPGSDPTPGVVAKTETPSPVAKQEPLAPTFTNSIGMEFVIVPKGKSWLGGGKDKLGDQEVEIPADFYLGKYEVTQEEWEKVMGENPSHFSRTGGGKGVLRDISDADLKRFPVENVSWDQCQVFVANLNQREKEVGWVYRLPTYVEWEYACRGGPMSDKGDSAFDFYFAKPTNTVLPGQANFKDGTGLNRTCKVGSHEANRLGLFDMHGNVWEWCDTEKESAGVLHRWYRGRGWTDSGPGNGTRAAMAKPPSLRGATLGLRLARVPAGASSPEAKTSPPAIAPFTDADVQRIAALPVAEQVEEVRKELMKRNPEFDGQVEHKSKDGVVTEVRIDTEKVSDISPIRVWNGLRALDCGTPQRKRSPLADLTPLKGMNLAGLAGLHLSRTRVDDAGLSYFKDCKNLTHLELNATKATDAGLANFKDCKNLRHLVLNGTQVTDVGMARFSDCKNLTTLSVSWTKLTDAGLTHFKECKNLAYLELGGTQTTDAGVAHFKDCKNLSSLYLFNTEVTDAGLTHLKDCKNLTTLSLSSCPQVSDAGLAHLAGLDSLTELTLTKTKVSAKGVEDLAKALPKCKITWDGGTIEPRITIAPFTDADIKRIAALPAEQQVEQVRRELMRRNPGFDGKMETKIEGDAVTEFGIVTDKVTDIAPIRVWSALRVLTCAGSSWRSGLRADLTPLVGMNLALLTHLDLKDTRVSDAGMVYFKDCKNLTELRLTTAPVTDAGLAHFKDCKNLTVLRLGGTGVTDAGLVYFKDCKALMKVHLQVTKVSDAGLAHFKGAPLTELFIDHTSITDLTPLQGMRLEVIRLTPRNITRGLDILRDMKSLKTIGIGYEKDQTWPAAEFWKRYDKGEFTK